MRGNSAGNRPRVKRSRTHEIVRYRGPRISRTRLRSVGDDLNESRNTVNEMVRKFWIMSEHDIRDILAKTEQKIGRAVNTLRKAA